MTLDDPRHNKTGEVWVKDGQRVAAISGPGDLVATGRVVAYTDQPTVTIRLDNGDKTHWIASMCRPIPALCGAMSDYGPDCDLPAGHDDWHSARSADFWIQWPGGAS